MAILRATRAGGQAVLRQGLPAAVRQSRLHRQDYQNLPRGLSSGPQRTAPHCTGNSTADR